MILCLASRAIASEYCFGAYEDTPSGKRAVLGEAWTFDHGAPDSLEGWSATRFWGPTDRDVIGHVTTLDFAQDGLPLGAPIIDGDGMIWAGLHADLADSLCYLCGMGYGPLWCQSVEGPPLPYIGGNVTIQFEYWTETDVSDKIFVRLLAGNCQIHSMSLPDRIGSWTDPILASVTVPASRFLACGASQARVRIELITGTAGDRDCTFDSEFGAFGIDNLTLSGGMIASYDFETDPGWTTSLACPYPAGTHVDTRTLANYGEGWENWVGCSLENRVLKFHDQEDTFSPQFDELAVSPVVDLASLDLVALDGIRMRADFLQEYLPSELPGLEWAMHLRVHPDTCSVTGVLQWGPWHRIDRNVIGYLSECKTVERDLSLDYYTGLPTYTGIPDSIQVGIHVVRCQGCTGPDDSESDQTPLFDNIQVCVDGLAASDVTEEWPDDPVRLIASCSPNPITAESMVVLRLDRMESVKLTLHDVTGRTLGSLLLEQLPPGDHNRQLSSLLSRSQLRREADAMFRPGMYFLRASTESRTETVRIVVGG